MGLWNWGEISKGDRERAAKKTKPEVDLEAKWRQCSREREGSTVSSKGQVNEQWGLNIELEVSGDLTE